MKPSMQNVAIGLQVFVLAVSGLAGYVTRRPDLMSWAAWLSVAVVAPVLIFKRPLSVTAAVVGWFMPLACVVLFGLLVSGRIGGSWIAARYFLVLPIATAAIACLRPESFKALIDLAGWILLLQLPVVLIQLLVVVPRSGSWDSVVGSFGGDPFGGGNSPGLAIFLSLALTLVLCRFRAKLASSMSMALAVVVIFAVASMAEIKTFMLIGPLILIATFRREVLTGPMRLIGVLAGAAVSLVVAVWLYWRIFYSSFLASPVDVIAYVLPELSGDDMYNANTGEVGRIAALRYWWQSNTWFDALIGSGPLSTQRSAYFDTGIDSSQAFVLANTTASALLWEIGLLGLACYLVPFAAALLKARALASGSSTPLAHKAIADAASIGIVVWVLYLFQSLSQYQSPSTQWLGALLLAAPLSLSSRYVASKGVEK